MRCAQDGIGRGAAALACGLLAAALGLGAGDARAAGPRVYHSPANDGTDPNCPNQMVCTMLGSANEVINVWIDLGTDPSLEGTPCLDGEGKELCAFDLLLELEGDGWFTSYTAPDLGEEPPEGVVFVHSPTAFTTSTKKLQINVSWALEPAAPGPLPVGVLTVNTLGSDGMATGTFVSVNGVSAIGAALQVQTVAPKVISLPEPAQLLLLLAGLLGLAGLDRLRRAS